MLNQLLLFFPFLFKECFQGEFMAILNIKPYSLGVI